MWSLSRQIGRRLVVLVMGAALASLLLQPAQADPCADLLPAEAPKTGLRQLEARDLVRLRDIGFPESSLYETDNALSVSPDGRFVAFALRRADPDADGYCSGLVVLNLESGRIELLDSSAELVPAAPVLIRGLLTPQGVPAPNPPRWSPDGSRLLWLKRMNGVTQAWIVSVAGSAARSATASSEDVEFATWAEGGSGIVFGTRPSHPGGPGEDSAGREGYLYDDRYMPALGPEPRAAGPTTRSLFHVDLTTRAIRPVEQGDLGPHRSDYAATDFDSSGAAILGKGGPRAWIASEKDGLLFSPQRLWVETTGSIATRCEFAACQGKIYNLQWNASGRQLFYLRREGPNGEGTSLYRWEPSAREGPVRLLSTRDVIASCRTTVGDLVCLWDSSKSPRRVVQINGGSGRIKLLFDPNPEFSAIRLGMVERLRWRNELLGLETWGDLVLPPDYRKGNKIPLIVVQYHSDGFLRGGTGDEYPIFLFAARGFAVLSIERVAPFASTLPGVRDYKEANQINGVGWRERWSLLSSIETGVKMVIRRGFIDERRVGLTGLSDGATTTQFALVNSKTFSAAAMSSCCIDANTVMIYGGPRWAEELKRRGYPSLTEPAPAFWAAMSLSANAAQIETPILLQLPSEEYLLALESFAALRELGKPVEMFVFPDEHHVKLHPAHRLAIYERSVAWFEFWFLDRAPAKIANDQYSRWSLLKSRQKTFASELPLRDP